MRLLEAFSTMEGFPVAGSRPRRNCNPLNLRWCSQAKKYGATRGDRTGSAASLDGYTGFAVFPDVATGWMAAQRWLSTPAHLQTGPVPGFPFTDPNGTTLVSGYLGATLAQVIHRFAPPNENDSAHYVDTVCRLAEVDPSTVLTLELLQLT